MPPPAPDSIPVAAYKAHKDEIDAAIARVLADGRYILGHQTESFENEFAAFLDAKHCIGVASGTDALELALRSCGIGKNDAVLTVSWTATATIAAIERSGAHPVMVDIDPVTFTMDPNSLIETITEYQAWAATGNHPRLKAVLPVHLYGHSADMPAIMEVASRHALHVIEDCAQAHGAALSGKTVGTWGDAAAFSFYPTKNLGALGDGGAVVTNDPRRAQQVRSLREYGWKQRFVSEFPGINSRLDEIQSAILRVLLKHLPGENARRRELAALYDTLLSSTRVTRPLIRPSALHAFHQYAILSRQRNELKAFLEENGVAAQIHYPLPVHRQPAYQDRLFCCRNGLPQTDAVANRVLSLPMGPHIPDTHIRTVCELIIQWDANHNEQQR